MFFDLKALTAALLLATAAFGAAVEFPGSLQKRAQPKGIDVSAYQPNVDWTAVHSSGVTFAYIKATEGTTYKSPAFNAQYEGATKAGLIRGAYHFARPDSSSGAVQSEYFAKNGGGWSGDGITLPGALDMEYGPDGDSCYGLSASAMVNWIRDFSNTYHAQVKRYPVIYTSTSWWQLCTGNNGGFGTDNPLWIARYASSPGTLPAGWKYHTFWQYSDKSSNPGDPDVFNGDEAGLKRLASG